MGVTTTSENKFYNKCSNVKAGKIHKLLPNVAWLKDDRGAVWCVFQCFFKKA
jgi:hypothetical protein